MYWIQVHKRIIKWFLYRLCLLVLWRIWLFHANFLLCRNFKHWVHGIYTGRIVDTCCYAILRGLLDPGLYTIWCHKTIFLRCLRIWRPMDTKSKPNWRNWLVTRDCIVEAHLPENSFVLLLMVARNAQKWYSGFYVCIIITWFVYLFSWLANHYLTILYNLA